MSVSQRPDREIDLSIVTTARNEAGNVVEFLDRSREAIEALGVDGEILFFDDASSDGTLRAARDYAASHPELPISIVRNPFQKGIVSAVVRGSSMARGRAVLFLPSDLESLPDEDIPKLYAAFDDETDVVVGWRQGRDDNKLVASSIYQRIMAIMFGVRVNDGNWIKLVRRDKLDDLLLLSDWHSVFIGLLSARGCRIREVPTQWHRRKYGTSKFGGRRFLHAITAALSCRAYLTFGERPLLLFLELFALFAVAALLFAVLAFLLPGGNVVLMLFSFTSLILGALAMTAGLTVEALRWGRSQNQIRLQDLAERAEDDSMNEGA